jgi:hypothetical protein
VTHEGQDHEALLYKRIRLAGGERLIETCGCGAQRFTERLVNRVEWSPWCTLASIQFERCARCGTPTHPGESNDDGVCMRCLGDDAVLPK